MCRGSMGFLRETARSTNQLQNYFLPTMRLRNKERLESKVART